jgi:hypothetical protein
MPALLLGIDAATLLLDAVELIVRKTCFHRPVKPKSRIKQPKPHKSMTQKTC